MEVEDIEELVGAGEEDEVVLVQVALAHGRRRVQGSGASRVPVGRETLKTLQDFKQFQREVIEGCVNACNFNLPGGEGVGDVGDCPVDGDALHGAAQRVAKHLLRPEIISTPVRRLSLPFDTNYEDNSE